MGSTPVVAVQYVRLTTSLEKELQSSLAEEVKTDLKHTGERYSTSLYQVVALDMY